MLCVRPAYEVSCQLVTKLRLSSVNMVLRKIGSANTSKSTSV